MINHVKSIIFYLITLLTGPAVNSKEPESLEYLKYVNEIVGDFTQSMKKKYELHCYGSGGSMPKDVEEIELMFISYKLMTVADARKMEVDAVQDLLQRINTHEKIRPYLREYPFGSDRVNVLVSFRTKTDDYPMDGSVALIFLARNKIFYRAAQITMSDPTPMCYVDDNNKWTEEIQPGYLEETLIPLHEETYEEALKIATITTNQN